MVLTRWEEYKKKNGSTPLVLLNPATQKTDSEEYDRRMSICNACPRLIKLTSQCLECGCFMKLKAGLEISTCPIHNWDEV